MPAFRHIRLSQLLRALAALLLLLALGAVLQEVCNRRDAPPPDLTGLELPVDEALPACSNGWYCIREAVRDAWVPPRTNALYATWTGLCTNSAGVREILASNALALAWVDRAATSAHIAPPSATCAEDNNFLGWSPIATCGRLMRLRSESALAEGRTNDAVRELEQSLRLARLYLDCSPRTEMDALAAFAEVRNALHAVRDASAQVPACQLWACFGPDLQELSSLREFRRRACACALAADRRELEHIRRIAEGTERPLNGWTSPLATLLPDDATLSEASAIERLAIAVLNAQPASYRLHVNRTLAIMAGLRRSGQMPAMARRAAAARNSSRWIDLLEPVGRLLGPNHLGAFYVMVQSERQAFIESGTRLAECAARGTRLSLALRLYEQEHGELPERLEALAPRWIEAPPVDPYDGRPFRYDRARRLVYAVGANRRDDGGARGEDVLFPVGAR
jgi:hypothetical protein